MKAVSILLLLLFVPEICGVDIIKGLWQAGRRLKKEFAPVSDEKAKEYLEKYGYNKVAASVRGLVSDFRNEVNEAVKEFQQFAGLPVTGVLDMKTKQKMAQPRCGVNDVQALTSGRGIRVMGITESTFKWNKKSITYSIENTSPDLPRRDAERAIRKAFDTWAKVVPLDFSEVSSGKADITIKFASQYHNDPWPFDGKGGTLAHATFPPNGQLHFDEDENWTYKNADDIMNGATDLYAVAIHESGHTLGLDHSRDESSIMAPFYHQTVDDNGRYITPELTSGDIDKIQKIYGSRGGLSSTFSRVKSFFHGFGR
uniref:Peptidase metallopeptidase domain-containing protein n=1 Tax=Panagrolaimus sp. ES5 TaxID=591445 RepID=A0AC34FU08_9BILA